METPVPDALQTNGLEGQKSVGYEPNREFRVTPLSGPWEARNRPDKPVERSPDSRRHGS